MTDRTGSTLERAMEVFREHGYEGASTRDLAALRRHCEHLDVTTRRALASDLDVRTVLRGLLEQAFEGSDPANWGPNCLLLRAATERAGRAPEVDRMRPPPRTSSSRPCKDCG
jgi:TetR/AcrR family transcriptional regulator, transcriptional repressor for nem operon